MITEAEEYRLLVGMTAVRYRVLAKDARDNAVLVASSKHPCAKIAVQEFNRLAQFMEDAAVRLSEVGRETHEVKI